jgi:hypothetical protein
MNKPANDNASTSGIGGNKGKTKIEITKVVSIFMRAGTIRVPNTGIAISMAPMRIEGHIKEPTNAVVCANPTST